MNRIDTKHIEEHLLEPMSWKVDQEAIDAFLLLNLKCRVLKARIERLEEGHVLPGLEDPDAAAKFMIDALTFIDQNNPWDILHEAADIPQMYQDTPLHLNREDMIVYHDPDRVREQIRQSEEEGGGLIDLLKSLPGAQINIKRKDDDEEDKPGEDLF